MYSVLYKNDDNDDTEELYRGTKTHCQIYMQGWISCMIMNTSYYQVHEDGTMYLRSPLISQPLVFVWIEEVESEGV